MRTPFQHAQFLQASVALHGIAVGLWLLQPQAWPWIIGGIAADHLALVLGGVLPRSTLLGPNLRKLPRTSHHDRSIALTFDDGPDPHVTPLVLARLDEYQAKATFFCVAERAKAAPGLIAEIVRRGHGVENHTYSHPNGFFFLGPRGLASEIDRAQSELARQAGSQPTWFRAPAGVRSPLLNPFLAARSLGLASWTRRGFDTVTRDPVAVAKRLCHRLSAGDILVMHDCGSALDRTRRPVVLESLPRVLDEMVQAGLKSVALPCRGNEADRG